MHSVPAGARHEHRLKTTLLSKASSGSQQQHSQQQYSQQQYSQQQRHGGSSPPLHTLTAAAAGGAAGRTGGAAGNNPSAVQGYAAVTGSASVDFGYQQGWESVDRHYTSQQQELPTSRHASSTAAGISARMDVVAAAAVNTSPSKTRAGSSYTGQQQQQYFYATEQQQYTEQSMQDIRQQGSRQYPSVPAAIQQQQQQQQQQCSAAYDDYDGDAYAFPEQLPAAAAGQPGTGSGYAARLYKSTSKKLSSKHGGSGSGSSTVRSSTTAATGQLAAGVSLAAEVGFVQQQQQEQQPLAIPSSPPKKRSSSKQSSDQQQQQQQQQQQESPATSSFGVRISGSVMAAFNGWMVNQAVNAATAAVTTALAGDSPSASSPAAAAAAAAADASRRDGPVRWSLGGFLRQSVSPSVAGNAAAAAAGAGGGGKRSKSKLAAVAAEDPYMNYLVGSGSSRDEAAADGADLQDVDLVGSSSSEEEDEVEHNQQQQQQRQGEAEADALGPLLSSEDEGAGAAAAAARRKGARRRRQAAAAAAGSIAAARQWAAGGEVTAQGKAEGSGFVFVGRPGVGSKVKVLRGLLLWHSKAASVKALGFGLYMVLLLGSIPRGLDYMQLTTLLPGLALLYLAYNMAKPWAIRGYCRAAGKSAAQLSARLATFEASAADRLIALCCRLAAEAGLWALAALALGHRALRGRKFTTSCWTVLSLWLLLLVSELRIMRQTLLAMLAYAGLFSVPWLYSKFRPVIDAVVYDGLHLLTLLVVHAERWAYGLAALAAALVWQMMASADGSGSLVVQGSAAAGAGLAVLVWRVAVAEV
uniref:Reticulon-like protein n=1 Tax=Tetradesmus obliquus TaxID=3088 RepID=A0A383WN01_TETOB|eukprot:jgi/Sobl393_1/18098/SZX71053.1